MYRITILVVLSFSLTAPSSAQQNPILKNVSTKEKAELEKKLDLIDKAMRQSDVKLLEGEFSNKFTSMGYESPMAQQNVLPQMFKQLPKGNLRLSKCSKTGSGAFEAGAVMPSIDLKFAIVFDEDFKLLKLDVIQGKAAAHDADKKDSLPDHIALPFHLVDGFILIDAQINGLHGKLMLDNGSEFLLFLNNNYLELKKDEQAGEGKAGSGQQLKLYLSQVEDIKIGTEIQLGSQKVRHADFKFVEAGISSKFLGFLGYGFLKDYEFKIDYDSQVIDLYRLNEADKISRRHFNKSEVLGVLSFTCPRQANIPFVEFQLGDRKFAAEFDTGSQGSLHISPEGLKRLVKSGVISSYKENAWYGQQAPGMKTFQLEELKYKDKILAKVRNVPNSSLPVEIAEGQPKLTMGYQFLKNYRTVWNYKNKTITLLSR